MFLDFHTHHVQSPDQVYALRNCRYGQELWEAQDISLGIHPWDTFQKDWDWDEFEQVAKQDRVRCIGEAGLDVVRGGPFQEEIFLKQIRIAEKLSKPMILHCVKAYNEIMAIHKIVRPRISMAIHGFNRKKELAKELIHRGFYLSFGGALLREPTVMEAFKHCPLERVFLETDDREDLKIEDVYSKAAELRQMSIDHLKIELYKNFYERFILAFPL
ncbi:TatD family hydrolase [Leadbetterella byssophila]|uniref:TatD family hydrolase n=1 Tax=Leadbetterella byssophila TaxID=316068 RepID=UPI0039A3038F